MGLKPWGALCVALAFAFGSGASQPLYGGKPEHLRNPEKKQRPPVADVEDCSASFGDDPKKHHPNPVAARQQVDAGDTALATAEHSKDDQQRVGLIKDAIAKYRAALIKDNWSVDATLKLAVAYDKAMRKGCAIAMLKRLSQMAGHNLYTTEATRKLDDIDANGAWFKGYRKDAMAAVGR